MAQYQQDSDYNDFCGRYDVDPTDVGVVGVGRIGQPVLANLVRAGHRVRAFDIRPDAAAQVSGQGAHWAVSATAAATGVEYLVTAMPGSPELQSLMLGDRTGGGGLLSDLAPGSTWLDLTSAAPDLGVALAREARDHSVGYLDAAVGGGVDAAQRGALTLYVGGDHALFEDSRSLLTSFADPERIHYMGGPGSGYLTKLLVNLLWFGQAVTTGEALLLAHSAGLDVQLLTEVLADSAASSEFVRSYLPALLNGDYLTSFGLDRCVEELAAIESFAAEQQTPFEVSSLVAKLHRDALSHFGPVEGELMGVAYLEHRAGVQLSAGRYGPRPSQG